MGTTKSIDITQYFSLINYTINDIEGIRNYINSRTIRDVGYLIDEPTLNFEVDCHAFPRWNTRVGPVIDDVETLETTLALLHAQRRVKLYPKQQIGIIDNDILFTFEPKGKTTISITTFYGRVSIVPFLENFDVLRKYNKKSGDFIKLEQSEEVLNAQSLVMQKEVMCFHGKYQKYVLERFNTHSGEIIYITVTEGPHNGLVMEVNPRVVDSNILLNKRCLGALNKLGYELFVEQYIAAMDEGKRLLLGLGA